MTSEEFFKILIKEIQKSPASEMLGKGFSTPTGDYRECEDCLDLYYLSTFYALSKIYSNSEIVEFNPDFGVESCLCKPFRVHSIYFREYPSYYILSTNLKRYIEKCNFYEVGRDPIDVIKLINEFNICIIGKIDKDIFLPVVQNLWNNLSNDGVLIFRRAYEIEKEILKWVAEKNGRSIPTNSGMMIFHKEI